MSCPYGECRKGATCPKCLEDNSREIIRLGKEVALGMERDESPRTGMLRDALSRFEKLT